MNAARLSRELSKSPKRNKSTSSNIPGSPLKKFFDPTPYYNPRSGVSKEEIIEIKKAFDLFDNDDDGSINPRELADAYLEMGLNANNKIIYSILGELDRVIDFKEFVALATVRPDFTPSRIELLKVFRIFDIHGQGKISKQDLKKLSEELGEEMSDEELKKMIKKADRDDDGFVTFDDFCMITFGRTYDEEQENNE